MNKRASPHQNLLKRGALVFSLSNAFLLCENFSHPKKNIDINTTEHAKVNFNS
jgi:hypothetical protein